MKIEGGWKKQKLKELEPGDLFYFPTAIYIKTDEHTEDDPTWSLCVNLDNGYIERFNEDVQVGIIEDATLRIGGYYK